MGLLRAAADAVLIGSGTLQASPTGLWTAESTYLDAAAEWAELRRRLGRPELPVLAVVTGSGQVDPGHPAFERGALVLTTDRGARRLAGRLSASSEVVSLGEGRLVDMTRALGVLRERGNDVVAVEAGPHVVGSMLGDGLIDELFVTLSPVLAGRSDGQTRLGMVAGRELLPDLRIAGALLGARRSGAHLFLHYALGAALLLLDQRQQLEHRQVHREDDRRRP